MQGSVSLPPARILVTHANYFRPRVQSDGALARKRTDNRVQSNDSYRKWCIEPELAIRIAMDLEHVLFRDAPWVFREATIRDARVGRSVIRMWSLSISTMMLHAADTFGFWVALKYYSAELLYARFLLMLTAPNWRPLLEGRSRGTDQGERGFRSLGF